MAKKMIIILISIIIIVIFLFLLKKKDNSDDLKIYFFNAGKADAILISKNEQYLMIDTGDKSLKNTISQYFKINNITNLEYLILTHFDKDHIGNASMIIDNIKVNEVIQSNYPKESEYYTNYLNSLTNKEIEPITIEEDYKITFEDLDIVINGPEKIYEKNKSNNSSLIVSITNGNNKFLFMGDAENNRLEDFINTNNKEYDFIKIPYHGNYLKKLDDLLNVVKSKYGVMTCSTGEGCEKETLAILDNHNIKYYMTKNGGITVTSNGTNIQIKQ